MNFIREIIASHTDAANWHQQYPWFSIGWLVDSFNKKNTNAFEKSAQQTAIHFKDIPRLHWLLHQAELQTGILPHIANQPVTNQPLAVAASHTYAEPTFAIDLSGSEDENEENEEMTEEVNENVALPSKNLSASLASLANQFKNTSASDEAVLAYQAAYQHTIDYFASQGIKLDAEPAKEDRLGQQLKTFTSWLRQMKPLSLSEQSEKDAAVELNAAHSLLSSDVLTEAMADILVKQNKKIQALQLLEKMLLLHPEKSLYFAARIEQIKNLK